MEAPGQPSVVELWRPTLPWNTKTFKVTRHMWRPLVVETPGCGGPWLWRPLVAEAPGCGGPWLWRPLVVEAPGCGGPWAAFSSGAVKGLSYPRILQKIKGDKTYVDPLVVEAHWLWRPMGNCPACPVLNSALKNHQINNIFENCLQQL